MLNTWLTPLCMLPSLQGVMWPSEGKQNQSIHRFTSIAGKTDHIWLLLAYSASTNKIFILSLLTQSTTKHVFAFLELQSFLFQMSSCKPLTP